MLNSEFHLDNQTRWFCGTKSRSADFPYGDKGISVFIQSAGVFLYLTFLYPEMKVIKARDT